MKSLTAYQIAYENGFREDLLEELNEKYTKCSVCGNYFIAGETGSREKEINGEEYEDICHDCQELVKVGIEPDYTLTTIEDCVYTTDYFCNAYGEDYYFNWSVAE